MSENKVKSSTIEAIRRLKSNMRNTVVSNINESSMITPTTSLCRENTSLIKLVKSAEIDETLEQPELDLPINYFFKDDQELQEWIENICTAIIDCFNTTIGTAVGSLAVKMHTITNELNEKMNDLDTSISRLKTTNHKMNSLAINQNKDSNSNYPVLSNFDQLNFSGIEERNNTASNLVRASAQPQTIAVYSKHCKRCFLPDHLTRQCIAPEKTCGYCGLHTRTMGWKYHGYECSQLTPAQRKLRCNKIRNRQIRTWMQQGLFGIEHNKVSELFDMKCALRDTKNEKKTLEKKLQNQQEYSNELERKYQSQEESMRKLWDEKEKLNERLKSKEDSLRKMTIQSIKWEKLCQNHEQTIKSMSKDVEKLSKTLSDQAIVSDPISLNFSNLLWKATKHECVIKSLMECKHVDKYLEIVKNSVNDFFETKMDNATNANNSEIKFIVSLIGSFANIAANQSGIELVFKNEHGQQVFEMIATKIVNMPYDLLPISRVMLLVLYNVSVYTAGAKKIVANRELLRLLKNNVLHVSMNDVKMISLKLLHSSTYNIDESELQEIICEEISMEFLNQVETILHPADRCGIISLNGIRDNVNAALHNLQNSDYYDSY